jgi:hypothetical protein
MCVNPCVPRCRWDLIIPYGGLQSVTVNLRLDTATATAGVALHFQSHTFTYMFALSMAEGLVLYRYTSATPVVVDRIPAVRNNITVGQWFSFTGSVTNLFTFSAALGNVTVYSGRDATGAGPTWGSAGMYADGEVDRG